MTNATSNTSRSEFLDGPVNRRRMLLGLAAASTAAAPVTALAKSTSGQGQGDLDEIAENPELVSAWKEHRAAEAEHKAAKDALGWLADEWKHLWPLAPEDILGCANAHIHNRADERIERDIIGRPMMREKCELTRRLKKRFREEGGKTAFFIDQPDELSKRLAQLRHSEPRGRTPRALERNRKWRNETIADHENRLRLATEYYAETNRIRALAGVDAAKQRIKDANNRVEAAAAAVSMAPSRTLVGLRLKADILLYTLEAWKLPRNDVSIFGAVWRLVEDALDATQHLDGKRSAAPLPTSKGGAA